MISYPLVNASRTATRYFLCRSSVFLSVPEPDASSFIGRRPVSASRSSNWVYTPDMVLGPDRKGIKLTYCTDTRPTESMKNNAAGSDLFICEGMYGEKDKLKKAKEYKHMTFYEAAQVAKEAGVKEMWLTHYSPSLTRPEEYMDEVRAIFPQAIAAKDRRSAELVFSD